MKFYSAKFAAQFLAKRLKSQDEIEALNFLIQEINEQGRKDTDNILFAKLYLHLYAGNIEVFKDTQGVRREIGNILRKPLANHVKEVTEAYTHVALASSKTDEELQKALKLDIENILKDMLNDFIEAELNDKKNND